MERPHRLPTEKKWIMSTKTMEQETIFAWQIQSCKAYSLTGFSTLLMSFLCKRSSEEGHNFFISISIYPEELTRQARTTLVLSLILRSIPFSHDYKFSFNVRHLDLSILNFSLFQLKLGVQNKSASMVQIQKIRMMSFNSYQT